jgi:D-alanyl-D-alanine carboxypeptidase/D-alanyl-D-alanine-endopeptidase (penicillin-binding protein 4)
MPLSAGSSSRTTLGDCGDYRAQLQPDLAVLRMAFTGNYRWPAAKSGCIAC